MQAQTAKVTYEEYLRLDAEAEEKREFYHGQLIDMAGEQPEHRDLKANLMRLLIRQEGGECRVYGEGTRVAAPGYGSGRYAYPDLYVVCGESDWDRSVNPPILLNPRLVVEVTSTSTAGMDLGPKVEAYFRNERLAEYWVVDAARVFVVRHTRLEGEKALRHPASSLDDVLVSEGLGLEIPLRDVYAGVIDE